MFEDLRNSQNDDMTFGADQDEIDPEVEALLKKKQPKPALGIQIDSKTFLGMNAFQRFIISVLVFFMVFALGLMFLLITGAIQF